MTDQDTWNFVVANNMANLVKSSFLLDKDDDATRVGPKKNTNCLQTKFFQRYPDSTSKEIPISRCSPCNKDIQPNDKDRTVAQTMG